MLLFVLEDVTEEKVVVVCGHCKLIMEFLFAFLITDSLSFSDISLLLPEMKMIVLEVPFNFRLRNPSQFMKLYHFVLGPLEWLLFKVDAEPTLSQALC